MEYYFDYSSLDYTIEFYKISKNDALKLRPQGILHGPFSTKRKCQREARKILNHYISELKALNELIIKFNITEFNNDEIF